MASIMGLSASTRTISTLRSTFRGNVCPSSHSFLRHFVHELWPLQMLQILQAVCPLFDGALTGPRVCYRWKEEATKEGR